mmetsp:Transcript_9187/g.27652  ORF Transcript_9187/g.27652 Transcript_9187/m.27652 type:complete len:87 (+) Transcript_9187:1867-2127(+)
MMPLQQTETASAEGSRVAGAAAAAEGRDLPLAAPLKSSAGRSNLNAEAEGQDSSFVALPRSSAAGHSNLTAGVAAQDSSAAVAQDS